MNWVMARLASLRLRGVKAQMSTSLSNDLVGLSSFEKVLVAAFSLVGYGEP